MPTLRPSPTTPHQPTATAEPTVTAEPTPTPEPDLPRFDEGSLSRVFIAHAPAVQGYPALPPFDPHLRYPEYPYSGDVLAPDNGAYDLVREALRLLSPESYGVPAWNPLSGIIRPGDRVLIKPNLVDDSEWINGQITHPAFLRPIIDYAYKACGSEGRILLAEGPWAAGVFDRLVAKTGIRDTVEHLATVHGVPVSLADLNKASPETTPLIDLGSLSELRSTDRIWYDAHGDVMQEDGDPGIGRYYIAPSVLEADVVICVPKAKVHCSGGVTLAMKNLLGIMPAWDGPQQKAVLKDCAHTSDADHAAGKRGLYLDNDTIWRPMADLNRILLYVDSRGVLHATRQRRYLAIVDGIMAAEESQYHPHPYPLNTVVVGSDPVTVDAVTARCMGFDPRLLKSVTRASARKEHTLGPAHASRVKVIISGGDRLSALYRHALTPELHVYSWQGHLEAHDFDPPQVVERRWDATDGELQAVLRDSSGVAWARLAYEYEGESRLKALELRSGTSAEGLWRASFPLGAVVRRATLMTGDELFNEAAEEIAW